MNTKYIVITIVLLVALIGGGYYFASNTNTPAQVSLDNNAKASVDVSYHDWGEIGINDGNVEAVFNITNEGSSPLKLSNVKTSCGCTTAQVMVNGQESSIYGMHTTSDDVQEVQSGETASIVAVFDPLFHGPDGIGPITRQIFVETNDPENPKLTFEASATVVK